MSEINSWNYPRGTLSRDGWETVVDNSIAGWVHTGLRVATLTGDIRELPAGPVERMVVPLSGSFSITTRQQQYELLGRSSVFDGPTDVLYLGAGSAAELTGSGRVAVAEAPATDTPPDTYLPGRDVPVEIRGAGRSTRQVHNFGTPGALPAAKLIVCEVITPAENWSSYPAHKHDETTATESQLEEIYYFETATTRGVSSPEADPFGTFFTYPSTAGEIHTAAMVRTGDVALVPYGYHGPAAAAPGYDLYYLNVMAGPGRERAWHISDDPVHAWVRDTWAAQAADSRLPYQSREARS